jgi:hypothetical protein
MSYQLCMSIVRMVGVFTVFLGVTLMAYSLIVGLAALQYMSNVTGGLAMRQFSGTSPSGSNELFYGLLLGEACIVLTGVLIVVWSPWLTRVILKDPGLKPALPEHRRLRRPLRLPEA